MDNLRLRQILALLKERKSCSIAELKERFNVSNATIHRDVALLAERDAIERVRGGIVYNGPERTRDGFDNYQNRIVARRREKISAAQQARTLITEGDIIFLDSSTTVYELAILLIHSTFDHLTIITNAIPIMNLFRKMPHHGAMIGLGGNFDPQLNSILGGAAIEHLSRFNITKAFVSAFGLDDKTATTNHEQQANILRHVLDAADKKYLIIDHTKIGRKGLYRIAARGGFDAILTD